MPSISFKPVFLSNIFKSSASQAASSEKAPCIDPLVSDVAFAIYHGGRVDGMSGIEVVAHVIQNRTKHPTFPSDAKSVVLSGTEQFTYTHLAATFPHGSREKQLFEQAQRLATRMVYPPQELPTPDPTGGALYYDKRRPLWLHSGTYPAGMQSRSNSPCRRGAQASPAPAQQRQLPADRAGNATGSRSSPATSSRSPDSDGGSVSLPPSPLRTDRATTPCRSRRPFSFLRKPSRPSLSIFGRHSEGSTSAGASSPDQSTTSSSSAATSPVPSHAGRESRRHPGTFTITQDGDRAASPHARAERDLSWSGTSAMVGPFTPSPPPSTSQLQHMFLSTASHRRLGNTPRLLVRPANRLVRNHQMAFRSSLVAHPDEEGYREESYRDMRMPCGLFQDQIIELMHRDLSPEDFDMLCKLDEWLPKRNTVHRNVVDTLPRVLAKDCGIDECRVCLSEIDGTTLLAQLPCQHAFHPACISKWLTQCKNTCPLCSVPIATPATGGSKDGSAPKRSDSVASSASCEIVVHRDALFNQRREEPRARASGAHQGPVRSLHL